jgi:hypothetical protein
MVGPVLADAPLLVAEPPPSGGTGRRPVVEARGQSEVSTRPHKPRAYRKRSKPAAAAVRSRSRPPQAPEGWAGRIREQGQNLARAIELLEQALGMLEIPRDHALARAQCLRGAGLLTLIAASELLLVAGWYEAEQAVEGGTD